MTAHAHLVTLVALLSSSCAVTIDPVGTAAGITGTEGAATTTPADPSAGTTSTSSGEPAPTTTGTGRDLGAPTCSDPVRCPPVCDTVLQDCPLGQKCVGVKPSLLEPYVGTACVPDNAGQGTPAGAICLNGADGSDSCDPASMCVQFGSGEGACVPFCAGSPDAPACDDPGLVCARVDHVWPLSLCVPPCDPLDYDCPDADLGAVAMVCQPAALGFGCVLRGNLNGHALGQPCENHRDCLAAARCAPPDDVPGCRGEAGCCAAYCDLSAPTCPLAEQNCVAYYAPGEAPPGLEDVGVCAAP